MNECHHHFILTPQAIECDGICKLCGLVRHFDGAYVDSFDVATGAGYFSAGPSALGQMPYRHRFETGRVGAST